MPPSPFPEKGRLLATAGAISLEGAGGGGLAPWALITGYGSRDSWGASVHGTGVRLPDFSLGALGIGVGVGDRLEFSYQHQWFDTGRAGARLGPGRGYTFEQDVFGAKLRLFGDVVADQDRWWPQGSVGALHKRSADGGVVRAVGARDGLLRRRDQALPRRGPAGERHGALHPRQPVRPARPRRRPGERLPGAVRGLGGGAADAHPGAGR